MRSTRRTCIMRIWPSATEALRTGMRTRTASTPSTSAKCAVKRTRRIPLTSTRSITVPKWRGGGGPRGTRRDEGGGGRWPVSTPAEAGVVAGKTIAYENGILSGEHPGLRRVAFFHVGGWVDARDRVDRLAGNLPAGWQAERFFYHDQNPKFNT